MKTLYRVYHKGRLIHGYDYDKQACVSDGKYLDCYHPVNMECGCYGRLHIGEKTKIELHPYVIVRRNRECWEIWENHTGGGNLRHVEKTQKACFAKLTNLKNEWNERIRIYE